MAGIDHLRLAGGGSTHPAWRQLLADVVAYSLRSVDVAAASGRGAAVLGAKAAGLLDEAVLLEQVAPVTSLAAHPRAHRSAQYLDRHQAFVRKLRALRVTEPGTLAASGAVDQSLVPPGGFRSDV